MYVQIYPCVEETKKESTVCIWFEYIETCNTWRQIFEGLKKRVRAYIWWWRKSGLVCGKKKRNCLGYIIIERTVHVLSPFVHGSWHLLLFYLFFLREPFVELCFHYFKHCIACMPVLTFFITSCGDCICNSCKCKTNSLIRFLEFLFKENIFWRLVGDSELWIINSFIGVN